MKFNISRVSLSFKKALSLIVITFFLACGVYAYTQATLLSTTYAQTTEPTVETLTNSLEELNKKPEENVVKLEDTAATREAILVEEAKKDPAAFLDHTTLKEEHDSFPEAIQEHVEEKVEQKGKLLVVHFDGKDHFKTDYKLLSSKDKKVYDLRFAKGKPDAETGSQVTVNAVQLDSQLVVEGAQQTGETNFKVTQEGPVPGGGTVDEKTAVILVNFANDTSTPISKAEIQSLLFTDTHSVNAFYKENSFNATSLSGEVYGWLTISQNNTDCEYNYYNWSSEADLKLASQGINLSTFSKIVYVFPTPPGCIYAGLGTIGGTPGMSWILGYEHDDRVYTHELGHNFGIHHANSLDCGDKSIDDYSHCYEEEYGDHFDVMGNFWYVTPNNLQFNAPHKVALGWIPPERTKQITTSGTYKVYPDEVNKGLVQALVIGKPDTGESYFVSYRQPLGFDLGLFDTVTRGASIHVWNGDPWRQTRLIDTTPKTGIWLKFDDATLADGKKFTDPVNKIEITQKSHTKDYSEVQIKFADQDKTAPSVSFTYPTKGLKVSKNTNITLRANASDNVGVVRVEFSRNGKLVCTDNSASYTCVSFTDSSVKKDVKYEAKAYDAAGNTKTALVTVTTK